MGSGGEQQATVVTGGTSPAEFLESLGQALREKENIDTGLADILAKHLLTATPTTDAVAKAKNAIMKLAATRADPPKPEADGG